jgi:RNA polymerase sigma-70 factor (sigma-E family)
LFVREEAFPDLQHVLDVVRNFDEFVTVRSQRLLQLAYLLTRDHALAEDLLQTTLAKCWTAWERIGGDPEPYVRRVMMNTYNSWWRRRWNGEHPAAELPELAVAPPQSTVDDRDEVWRALSRLPKRQRAVLVLRYFEDLSETQIAETMAISASAVRSYVTKALAKLRIDPSLRALPVPDFGPVPEGTQRLAAVRHRVATARRRRVAAAATVVGAVLTALLVGLITSLHPRAKEPPADPTPSPYPAYAQGYHTVVDKQVSFLARKGSVTFTPSTLDLQFVLWCEAGDTEFEGLVTLKLNGRSVASRNCAEAASSFVASHEELSAAGVVAGQQVTVNVEVQKAPPTDGRPWAPGADVYPAGGMMRVVIGEAVAFAEYPLPQAPATLKPLWYTAANAPRGSVVIRDAAPRTVKWTAQVIITAVTQTPGQLIVKVNGQVVRIATVWDYEQMRLTYEVPYPTGIAGVGADVVVTVEPVRMNGTWMVTVGSTA